MSHVNNINRSRYHRKKAADIHKSWNLVMNIEKHKQIKLIRVTKKEDEKSRQSKKLGTLLGDNEEMKRRKQLVNFRLVLFLMVKVISYNIAEFH